MYKSFFKRPFDFTAALLGLLLLSPLFLLVTVTLWIANNGKPFFLQPRPGKNEKLFKVIKFRTMNEKKDQSGQLLPPVERITLIGKFLRSTSLDELPQLIKVLKGDMSLVGPRPLRVEYLPYYTTFQAKRHHVRPGITGWTQVNGRNTLSWEEKFSLDVWYVENLSLKVDIKIILLTFWKVVARKDINQTDDATMKPFKGIKLNN